MALRGLHVNAWTPATDWMLRRARPALVKSLDWSPDWARAIRDYDIRVFILRKWADDDSSFVPSPRGAAERLWRRFAADFGHMQAALMNTTATVYLETPWNECHQETPDELSRLAEANARFVELGHAAGWKVLAGNFSVCWPKVEHVAAFAPAVAVADGLSVHEYWMPDRLYPGDWTAKSAALYAALPTGCPRPPVFITECGIDNVDRSRPLNQYGWRSYGRPAAQYVAELDQFAASQPPIVAGMALFNCGEIGTRWKTFEVAESEPVAAWLAAGPREWTPPRPTEEGKPVRLITDFGQVAYPTWRELAPWPYEWSQLTDWSVDQDGDQGRANNCGPQSVAAALHHLGMGEWGGDVIREIVAAFFGGSQADYLQVEQLTKFLGRFAGIECDTYQGDGNTLLRPVVEESVMLGYPLIVLFAWDYDQFNATGHFLPVVGYDERGVYCHQVWGGGRVFMAWDEFEAWQKYGTAFRLRRRRSSQVSRY